MMDRYDELYRSFRWQVPEHYNIAQACCGQWAPDRARFALYWEDESGAQAAYSFRDIQVAANRLSNALAAISAAAAPVSNAEAPRPPNGGCASFLDSNGGSKPTRYFEGSRRSGWKI